jgi:N6-adenosine-specific RNA methylase IME4
MDELCKLPIQELARADCHLHMWVPMTHLEEAFDLMRAWGFRYAKSGLVWCKSGQFGPGNNWREGHELLLLGLAPAAKRFADRGLNSWTVAPRGVHSEKPSKIRKMIEKASPGPRLELFGRHRVKGWEVWGNQEILPARPADEPDDEPDGEQYELIEIADAERMWAQPSIETTSLPPVRDLLAKLIESHHEVLDPFARNAKWGNAVTNDLNPETSAEYHMDALAFLRMLRAEGRTYDRVIFDPPFSARQVDELYQGYGHNVVHAAYHRDCRDEIAALVKPGGLVISFGWNSTGMGVGRGFERIGVYLIAHGGSRNDTIMTVERKVR